MQSKFSDEINSILTYSREEAMRLGSNVISNDHLFLGILRQGYNIVLDILYESSVDVENLKISIENLIKREQIVPIEMEDKVLFTKHSEDTLKIMFLEAKALNYITPMAVHLLLAILRTGDSVSKEFLEQYGITYEFIKNRVTRTSRYSAGNPNNTKIENLKEIQKDYGNASREKQNTLITLNKFCIDLTSMAAKGNLDMVVGRDIEIERVAQILGRRKKNNPIIIGEPGVGKSAIAEGLAIKISQGNISSALRNKRVLSLDIGSLVAGTQYRGQFEERMKLIIKEISSHPEIILFIDEIHSLVGAGSVGGSSLDAANMLKPALAKGDIQCIGTSTKEEYRQYIEKDGALERRFQKVIIEPTNYEETLNILQNIKDKYEQHHNVIYSDEALKAAVRLSERYITDRFLPDKAIDILDEAGSKAHSLLKLPEEIIEREKELDVIKNNKTLAINNQDFTKAATYRDIEKQKIEEINNLKKEWEESVSKHPTTVTEDDIATIISASTNIPVTKIAQTETNKLRNMPARLKELIIGQDDAVDKVSKAIQRNRAGLKDPNRPIGTFLFLGPTGVGKTQLTKILAQYMFDSTDSLVRIDMSEYTEQYSVSKLIGSPPGYVGYNEGGQLSERVRHKPYSVVLLDEIEKAHPDIFNLLLQVLDEGRLTDSTGKYIDFRNTVLILTSNIGTKELSDYGNGLGFSTSSKKDGQNMAKDLIDKAIKKAFRPEFINRLDELITFNKLSRDDIFKIIDIELKGLHKRVEEAGYKLRISPKAKLFVASSGYDPQYGARPLKRAIQRYIEDPIAELIISQKVAPDKVIKIGISKDNNGTEAK